MTPVLRLTRAVFVLGTVVTAGAGIVLVALPAETERYWSWPIAAAPTAAFLGASYLGAALSLGLSARERGWPHARLIGVLALALTSLMLLVTLRDLAPFELEEGGITGVMAWTWLVVYVVLPPVVLLAFVLQERAGGRREYDAAPARPGVAVGLGAASVLLGLVGLGLLLDWNALEQHWPWPLTRLTAGAVGAWLCTYALGLLWFVLRERSWRRMRAGAAGLALSVALHLASAARLRDDLDGGVSTLAYVAGCLLLLAAIGVAALVEER